MKFLNTFAGAVTAVTIVMMIVFFIGRASNKKKLALDSKKTKLDKVKPNIGLSMGYTGKPELTQGRIDTLKKVFRGNNLGLLSSSDRQRIYDTFSGIQSPGELVRIQSHFELNGRNLTESMSENMLREDILYVDNLLKNNIGMNLIKNS